MSMAGQKKNILLLEPDAMVRRTVALTARSTGLADIHEAPSLKTAQEVLRQTVFDGLLLSLDEENRELDLIERLRAGETPSPAGATIAVMVTQCDQARAEQLRVAGVNQIILRPFKVKTLLQTILSMST
jgi:AmiR/NasT family two-component response regulator